MTDFEPVRWIFGTGIAEHCQLCGSVFVEHRCGLKPRQ